MDWLQIDDPVSAVPVHGFCGAWGLIVCGLASDQGSLGGIDTKAGVFKGGPWSYLGYQALAVVTVAAWTACTAYIEVRNLQTCLFFFPKVVHIHYYQSLRLFQFLGVSDTPLLISAGKMAKK